VNESLGSASHDTGVSQPGHVEVGYLQANFVPTGNNHTMHQEDAAPFFAFAEPPAFTDMLLGNHLDQAAVWRPTTEPDLYAQTGAIPFSEGGLPIDLMAHLDEQLATYSQPADTAVPAQDFVPSWAATSYEAPPAFR
jgi:hypothetical protein